MSCASVSFSGGKFSLTKDLYVNSGLIGPFDSTSDVNVFLEDSIGNPITPTGSALVGNDLTITANIPNPNGVALQFPTPSQFTSYRSGDTGWRSQNGWYNYTSPIYPEKYAMLDNTGGSINWFRLKTPLRVGGVLSTERFVDINGVQGWGLAGNAFVAVIDKLTGLMFTRSQGGGVAWNAAIDNALTYSVVINGVTYDDWFIYSDAERMSIFGNRGYGGNWIDTNTGITITNFPITTGLNIFTADTNLYVSVNECFMFRESNANALATTGGPKTFTAAKLFYIRNATNLISA
jgi:hypothetical protein